MERVVNRALAIKPDDAPAIYFHGYVLIFQSTEEVKLVTKGVKDSSDRGNGRKSSRPPIYFRDLPCFRQA